MEGFYQLFVLLTTANHPDVLMNLFYANNHLVIFCVSYMVLSITQLAHPAELSLLMSKVITNICFMNLVLAVMTDAFDSLLEQRIVLQEARRNATLLAPSHPASRPACHPNHNPN